MRKILVCLVTTKKCKCFLGFSIGVYSAAAFLAQLTTDQIGLHVLSEVL